MLRVAAALGALGGAAAWWSSGTLPNEREFALYVGKFCFDCKPKTKDDDMPVAGIYAATVFGHVEEFARENSTKGDPFGKLYFMVFSDEKDHWMRARPYWDELTCQERLELASWASPVSEFLGSSPFLTRLNVSVHQELRPRFWYFSFLNCGARLDGPVHFEVHALNIEQGFQAEFSLDLRHSVFLEAAFAGLFALVVVAAVCARRSRTAQLEAPRSSSPLLRLLCICASCSALGSTLRALHHVAYAHDGRGVLFLAVAGAFLACAAKALILILHFIVAKGWAVLFNHDDWPRRCSILVLLSTVVCLSVGCEIWEQYFHDQSTAFYHYESWPGRLILGLNVCLMAASLFFMRGTYKRESRSEVRTFYALVTAACGIYFAATPVVCLLAELLDPWVRRKYVERTEIGTRFAATVMLLLCLRPSRLDRLIAARLKNGDQDELLDKPMEEEMS